jgi:RNase P/RNase MRP subunit p30
VVSKEYKMIISEKIEEVRKQAEKLAKEVRKVIVLGRDIEFNRKILEMKKVNMLVLQNKIGRDKLKQRDSGLNEVLCDIAKKNNVIIGIDFSEILNSEGKERGKILGRVIQNLKLMKKAKNKIEIINKPADRRGFQALFLVLGIDTKLASELAS